MPAARYRTLQVELPDILVRQAAAHVGAEGGFSAVVERALEFWLEHRGDTEAAGRDAPPTIADSSQTDAPDPLARETV